MLKVLISKYEEKSSLRILDDDSEFIEYLKELENDVKKLAYLDLRISNPTFSQKEISKEIGVTPKTICEWQRDSMFNRVLVELSQEFYKLQRTEVINLLYEKAKKGDFKAIEIFLKNTNF